ncbi:MULTISPECIES: hypothetical protein [unclassified Rhizobium]|nr:MULTISPECIES: hypothetical protein [unclassified Rhizobium]MBO9101662.1 hypothetical protein [Rhizobium sp. L58/93]QXZ86568.1 hypothetical protein J5287_26525 [Rhizobium sp. K1/93]QXZ93399.1 hypothetical protein J5280_22660 [Rhizobium sp. K15/93]QYA04767.1 hypothetical protein J5278_21865 [Rhizobium sp. B21/90]
MDDQIYNSPACNCAGQLKLQVMTVLSGDRHISAQAREVQNSGLAVNAHE